MGLQAALGFRWTPPNPLQHGMQAVAATSAGSWVFQRTLYRVDRPVHRWTKGRYTVPGVMTGLPVIMLTTTGAKSGVARTMPVAGIPFGENLVVLGTNFAQEHTPGWVFNLEKDPYASVTWRSTTVPVVATRAPAGEMAEVWDAAARVYVGFPKYQQRLENARDVRAFVLSTRADAS